AEDSEGRRLGEGLVGWGAGMERLQGPQMLGNVNGHADHAGRDVAIPDPGNHVQKIAGMAVILNGDFLIDNLAPQGAGEAVAPDVQGRVRSRLAVGLEAADGTVASGRGGVLHLKDAFAGTSPAFEWK